MTRQTSAVRPPLIAAWLVDLVAAHHGQAESLLGDLLEEFSDLASKSGLAAARRWYWRQSVRTIAHLVGAGFRVAPRSIAGAVVLGYLLRWFSAGLPEKAVVALLRTQRPYSNTHAEAYIRFLTWGMLIGPLMQSMLIGCMVAVLAKGREVIAGVPFLVRQFTSSTMIVIGGVIVRESRSALARRTSSAR